MKDLKHLIYFENLLQEANNELVQQAKAEGEHALGYTCYFVPETLLNLPGCFSSRLRAPNTGSIDVGTYYMSSKICSYTRCEGMDTRTPLSSSAALRAVMTISTRCSRPRRAR